MLNLLKPFSQRLTEQVASSSTPKAGGDLKHEVVEEQSLDDKLPSVVTDAGEILRKRIPRVRKVSSVPNQEGITQCVHPLSERSQV